MLCLPGGGDIVGEGEPAQSMGTGPVTSGLQREGHNLWDVQALTVWRRGHFIYSIGQTFRDSIDKDSLFILTTGLMDKSLCQRSCLIFSLLNKHTSVGKKSEIMQNDQFLWI